MVARKFAVAGFAFLTWGCAARMNFVPVRSEPKIVLKHCHEVLPADPPADYDYDGLCIGKDGKLRKVTISVVK